MKRRDFIKTGSIVAAATALPMSKVFANQDPCVRKKFTGNKKLEDTNETLFFSVVLCPATLAAFDKAADDDKTMDLIISKYVDSVTKVNQFTLAIKAVKPTKEDEKNNELLYKVITNVKEEFSLPKELKIKKLKLVCVPGTTNKIIIYDKKKKEYVTLFQEYESSSNYNGGGCFLTTACVETLGKPDNCTELTILRNFRDRILKNNDLGNNVINDYYTIAPKIVEKINSLENRQTIYEHIYHEMILPTIEQIENNADKNAIELYKKYTIQLKETYLN